MTRNVSGDSQKIFAFWSSSYGKIIQLKQELGKWKPYAISDTLEFCRNVDSSKKENSFVKCYLWFFKIN